MIEISDLRSHTYSTGVKAKLIRFIERMAFRYVNKLIVTSPKFYELYYGKFFKGEYFILENKPLSTMVPKKIQKKKTDKTIIGIVGLLLQGRPYQTLFEALGGDMRYEIHIYGKGTYQKLVDVITSYSIHYTKLYESRTSSSSAVVASSSPR